MDNLKDADVCVIIPTRNMARQLDKALRSVCIQTPGLVIVVDDASDDDTPDVVSRYADEFGFVASVRWPSKSECHVTALETVYDSLRCKHVIGLAADDLLMHGLIGAIRDNIESPVIFTNYSAQLVTNPDLRWTVSHPYTEATALTPDEMRLRVQTQPSVETGIGSSIRWDVLQWLRNAQWQKLGPHQDSVGYATAACVFGCVYLPMVGAHVYFNPQGYGQKQSEDNRDQWCEQILAFASRASLDEKTTQALLQKRAMQDPKNEFWYQQLQA